MNSRNRVGYLLKSEDVAVTNVDSEAWGPIVDSAAVKAVDVHKMYSDRITVLRAIAALMVPVVLFALKVVIDAGSKNPWMTGYGMAIGIAAMALAVFIRVTVNRIIKDYEYIVPSDLRHKYRLLPLDALMSANDYFASGTEVSECWNFANIRWAFTNIICILGAVATVSLLLLAVFMLGA